MSSVKKLNRTSKRNKWLAIATPLKKTRTISEKTSSIDEEKCVSVENVLTTAYGVIKLILSQLDWSDLINASEVCREWKNVADVIFCERFEPSLFYLDEGDNDDDKYVLEYSSFIQYSKPALCLVFMNEIATTLFRCKYLPKEACLPDCVENHRLLQFIELQFDKSGCDIVAICSNSAKSSFNEPAIRVSYHKRAKIPGLVGVSLPKIPNVKMSKFYIKKSTNFVDAVHNEIGDNHHLKCLMTFVGIKRRSVIEQTIVLEGFIRAVCRHQPTTLFAFGGGIIHGIKESHFEKPFQQNEGKILCVTFSVPINTSPDFNASSVILWENAREDEDIDAIFENLSKHTVRRQHMVAFRFACVSRYQLSEIEADCFQKYFPNVSMVGFEGLGEIGLYTVQYEQLYNLHPDTDADIQDQKRHCTDPEFAHSNTSVIILLSWGKITSMDNF